MYKCKKCDKSFKSALALRGHQRVHSKSYQQDQDQHSSRLRQMADVKLKQNTDEYYKDPIRCLNCNKIIPYEKTTKDSEPRKFCNCSCSASYNNKHRICNSKPTPPVRKPTVFSINYHKSKISGEYCKVFCCTCSHCHQKFVSRRQSKYCEEHSYLYKRNNRNRYAFAFSLSQYPDLFGHISHLLEKFGMWNPKNTNGLTRDHKVSVNEAIKNNYNPYYITHPLNCELMPWHENNKKNTTSSLVYEELKKLVDDYESSKSCLAVETGIEPAS